MALKWIFIRLRGVLQTRNAVNYVLHRQARVATRVRDANLAAMYKLVIPRVAVVLRSANAFSVQDPRSVAFDPEQKEGWGNVEGLQMTASSGVNSVTNLNCIDESMRLLVNFAFRQGKCRSTRETLTGIQTLITNAIMVETSFSLGGSSLHFHTKTTYRKDIRPYSKQKPCYAYIWIVSFKHSIPIVAFFSPVYAGWQKK